jgi:AraC-like DNA-binding protein
MKRQHSISSYYAHTLLQGALSRGFSVERLITECGLSHELLSPECQASDLERIPTDKVSHLIRSIWSLMDDEFMGFTDIACKQGVFAIVAKQLINDSTLGEALNTACYLYRTIRNDIDMRLEQYHGESRLLFTPLKPELDSSHFLVEFFLLIWHRFASWLVASRLGLKYATFNYPSPRHVLEYSLLFPCHCRFNEASCSIVFDSTVMSLPIKQGLNELEIFLQNSPSDLLSKPDFQRTYTTQVMNALQGPAYSLLDIESLAKTFSMSARNLRRRLKAEGTSYQEIKDKLRVARASSLLREGKLSVNEISRQVGFQEAAAFTRAFKNWTGLSPRAFKEKYA